MLHEVLREEADPCVVSIEDYPLPCCFGLPDEVVLQECRRIQVHYHVDEAWDAASGESLQRDTTQFLPLLIIIAF